jgi:hypothetical protein
VAEPDRCWVFAVVGAVDTRIAVVVVVVVDTRAVVVRPFGIVAADRPCTPVVVDWLCTARCRLE